MTTPQLNPLRWITTFLVACAVACVLFVAGCGSGGGTGAPPAAAPPSPTATVSASGGASSTEPAPATASPTPTVDKEITVVVAKRKVSPPTGRVEVRRGALVRITVTSDVKDSVHVHGYDRTVELPAGVQSSLDLRADTSGLFEVETHETDLVLFQLVVR